MRWLSREPHRLVAVFAPLTEGFDLAHGDGVGAVPPGSADVGEHRGDVFVAPLEPRHLHVPSDPFDGQWALESVEQNPWSLVLKVNALPLEPHCSALAWPKSSAGF